MNRRSASRSYGRCNGLNKDVTILHMSQFVEQHDPELVPVQFLNKVTRQQDRGTKHTTLPLSKH